MPDKLMSRGEREDLQRLIRQREKVMKSAATQRSSELMADFENQLGAEYAFDDDAVWAEAKAIAEQEVVAAQQLVANRCRELGIPEEFSPSLHLAWFGRGPGNDAERRKAELRRMAKKRVEALEAAAVVKIEIASVEAQSQLAMAGLTSEGAQQFFNALPKLENLMERLSFDELSGRATPPLAAQLTANRAVTASASDQEPIAAVERPRRIRLASTSED